MAQTKTTHCQNFQKHLKKLGVSGYWVTHFPDLFYLAGYGSDGCWGLVGTKGAAMIVPGLAAEQAAALAPEFKILTLKRASDAYQAVINYALENKWTSVGYDPYHTQEAYINALRKASGRKLKWVPLPSATTPLRIKKDLKEIQSLRKAGN